MLHRSEWLDQCKRVPVGQSRRIVHGAEGRPNMVLYNNPDSWSVWCHSCHEGGRINKEYLEPVDTSVPVYRKFLDTKGLVTLAGMDKQKYKDLVMLLHSKGMSTALVSKHNCFYNTVDDRLVFRFNGLDIGRDCTGRSPAKWLHYDRDNRAEFVYLQGKTVNGTEPLVLVEDLFSAIKVNHYTGWSSICCLGTRISDEIIRFISSVAYTGKQQGLLQREAVTRIAVASFDGDSAGRGAERDLVNRCSLRGLGYRTVRIPDGLDPKDLNHTQLIETFKFLENLNDNSSCQDHNSSSS